MDASIPVALTILLTFITPFLISMVNRVRWSAETKNLVAIGFSLLVAIAYLILSGGISDWSQIPLVFTAVYGLQQLIYNYLLKNVLKTIEIATDSSFPITARHRADDTVTEVVTTTETVTETITESPVIEEYTPIAELITTSTNKG